MATKNLRPQSPSDTSNDSDIRICPEHNGACPPDVVGSTEVSSSNGHGSLAADARAHDNNTGNKPTHKPIALLRRASKLRPPDHCDWECLFGGSYPDLAACMGRGSWDELQPRDPARLTLSCKGGNVWGTLNTPTESLQITLGAITLTCLLSALDDACRTGQGPWIDSKYGTGAQRKRDARKKEVDKLRSGSLDSGQEEDRAK